MVLPVPLIRLECGVNSYDWGKVGKDSAAAKFAASTTKDFNIESEKPYAELWMGTHPSLPSRDLSTQKALIDIVKENQALMSIEVSEKYNSKLPFLYKVLSIHKALSIQAHPNKKLAEKLHAKDSKNYPDDNHKPEMAIAITPFDGLCGFRPLAEIVHFLNYVPAFRKAVGEDAASTFEENVKGKETTSDEHQTMQNKEALQKCFTALMSSKPEHVETCAKELVEDAKKQGGAFAGNGGHSNNGEELSELVIRLDGQFPHDIGLLVLFFLNYVKMQPGEALYLKADDIHAYLSGDIIECMASSDNVVRAGFTPKFKDVSTLTSMLTYNYAPIAEQKMSPTDYPYVTLNTKAYSSNSSSILYDPPIEEFSVIKTDLKADGAKATFEGIKGPSIFICTEGKGKISVGPKSEEVGTGFVFFVGATAEVVLEAQGEGPFVTFKAFCELGEGKAATNGH